jgi:RimJ/RimL family protein N-acetyltransferase
MSPSTEPSTTLGLAGTLVSLSEVTSADLVDLRRLDWLRSNHAEMGGWFDRPAPATGLAPTLFRSKTTGEVLGVLDGFPLPGYPGVVNVSLFTDATRAPRGYAMDAYGLYVGMLFANGVRIVHHEVLEFNRQVRRILRGIDVEPSARLRDHAYSGGRLWDVLIYSFDREHFSRVLIKFERRRVARPPLETKPPEVQAMVLP